MSILEAVIAGSDTDGLVVRCAALLTFFGATLEAQLEVCPPTLPRETAALPGRGLLMDFPDGDYWASSPVDALLGCLSALVNTLGSRLVVQGLDTDELDERLHAVYVGVEECLARGASVTLASPELAHVRTVTAELAAALGPLPPMPSRAALAELILSFEHP